MTHPIKNLADLEFSRDLKHGDRFAARVAPLSTHIGATKLAYNLTEVEAGKRAFPFHNHHTNEEMFLILEGEGHLRFGEEEFPVKKGDVICCPPGGTDKAHQLVNSSNGILRYFSLSTTLDTDVFQYPDSGKFGVVAGRKPGTKPLDAPFAGFYAEDAKVDYWEGE